MRFYVGGLAYRYLSNFSIYLTLVSVGSVRFAHKPFKMMEIMTVSSCTAVMFYSCTVSGSKVIGELFDISIK